MTTSELSLEQQLELAKKIDQGKNWEIFLGSICEMDANGNSYGFPFNPSLTGEDWQQAQALRVIVAAFDAGEKTRCGYIEVAKSRGRWFAQNPDDSYMADDLLEVCALALLGDKT